MVPNPKPRETRLSMWLIRSCPGPCAGDLSQIVDNMAHTRLPEGVVRRLFQQLVVAIDYCHRLGIANRDIKARRCRRCSWQLRSFSRPST